MLSGPPNRRKKRSIGESEPPSVLLSASTTFSFIVTLTEITDGFTRSTISAKPVGWATPDTALLACA